MQIDQMFYSEWGETPIEERFTTEDKWITLDLSFRDVDNSMIADASLRYYTFDGALEFLVIEAYEKLSISDIRTGILEEIKKLIPEAEGIHIFRVPNYFKPKPNRLEGGHYYQYLRL